MKVANAKYKTAQNTGDVSICMGNPIVKLNTGASLRLH
jgi:hypothetical protein